MSRRSILANVASKAPRRLKGSPSAGSSGHRLVVARDRLGAVSPSSFAKRYLEPASWVAVIIGIALGLWQLYIAHRDRQVDATLAFAARFSDDTAGSHRRALEALWLARPREVRQIRALSDKDAQYAGVVEEFKRNFILPGSAETSSNEVVIAITEIADFIDQLNLCVESSRCDREIASDYFCRYSASFLGLYGSDLKALSDTTGNDRLGAGLRDFVTGETCVASPDRWYWPF